MVELTVPNAAATIAAGIFLAHLLSPNALALILSRLLGDKNTAASWSVANAAFYQSKWPFLLQTDSAHNHGVPWSTFIVVRSFPLMGILISITAVVTPLGLYGALDLGDAVAAPFVYTADTSPFGYGTPPRNAQYSWSRICGTGYHLAGPSPCPFSDTISVVTATPNGTMTYDYPYGYNLSVPDFIVDTYSSGTTEDSTISNALDIQWRRYTTLQVANENNGSAFLVAASRHMDNLVQNGAHLVVEGLVVDAVAGGIGFRNHTVPPGFTFGATWAEDLLFVEPESVCVDTNLTLDYEINNVGNAVSKGIFLTDRGGFVDIVKDYPEKGWFGDTQKDPQMWFRAYKAAWMHSMYTALTFNITNPHNGTTPAFSYMNSSVGRSWQIAGADDIGSFNALSISRTFNDYLHTSMDGTTGSGPWRIGSDNYTDISLLCAGAGDHDYANITNILTFCGLMRSAPQRVDNGDSNLIFETGSQWSQKLFACATSVKASVKTVEFSYDNTGASLQDLSVRSIVEKKYDDKSSIPVWAVENTGNAYFSMDLNPVWGLVDSKFEGHPNVSTVRQPSLYLPGWLDSTNSLGMAYGDWENLPASEFPIAALSTAYTVGGTSSSVSLGLSTTGNGGVDYTGNTGLAMWARWQNLTAHPETASLIPNLIWTDQAASLVVGTKGAASSASDAQKLRKRDIGQVPPGSTIARTALVTPTRAVVRYNIVYAIPAFLCALLLLLIVVAAFVSFCAGGKGGGTTRPRRQVQALSPGRVYTVFLHPGDSDLRIDGKQWNRSMGKQIIDISEATSPTQVATPLPEKEPIVSAQHRPPSEES